LIGSELNDKNEGIEIEKVRKEKDRSHKKLKEKRKEKHTKEQPKRSVSQ
jgi:hypothetical protein